MDDNCWKVLGLAAAIVIALVTTIKFLWGKFSEERAAAEQARKEIVDLHKQRIEELEGFRRMVESRGTKP